MIVTRHTMAMFSSKGTVWIMAASIYRGMPTLDTADSAAGGQPARLATADCLEVAITRLQVGGLLGPPGLADHSGHDHAHLLPTIPQASYDYIHGVRAAV
eukprot:jgi/Ulvmu1/4068/UM019_0046.1